MVLSITIPWLSRQRQPFTSSVLWCSRESTMGTSCCMGRCMGCLLQKLQRVQNSAARLVTKCPRSDHITTILRKLHWLPVKQRIQYKLLVTTYKALHGSAPSYLSVMLQPYQSTCTLRSNELQLLHVLRARCGYGDRSFAVAAPRLWNSIPLVIKSCTNTSIFKNHRKTYLFTKAFNYSSLLRYEHFFFSLKISNYC